MKLLAIMLSIAVSVPGFAANKSTKMTEIPGNEYGVFKFETARVEGAMAASFISPDKLSSLFNRLSKAKGPVQDAVNKVFQDRGCDIDGSFPGEDRDFCGTLAQLDSRNTVLWSYYRSGWADAEGVYRSFLAFTNAGTGQETIVALIVESRVMAEPKNLDSEDDRTPPFIVTYAFDRVTMRDIHGKEKVLWVRPYGEGDDQE